MKEDDVDILARTIYGEARGEGQEGMEAVACVVMNRYKDHKWYTGYVLQDQRKIADMNTLARKETRLLRQLAKEKEFFYEQIIHNAYQELKRGR